jgi:hypothetical protein
MAKKPTKEPRTTPARTAIRRDRDLLEALRQLVSARAKDGYSGPKALRELADAASTIVSAEGGVLDRELRIVRANAVNE